MFYQTVFKLPFINRKGGKVFRKGRKGVEFIDWTSLVVILNELLGEEESLM
jgi:hypothetical protein